MKPILISFSLLILFGLQAGATEVICARGEKFKRGAKSAAAETTSKAPDSKKPNENWASISLSEEIGKNQWTIKLERNSASPKGTPEFFRKSYQMKCEPSRKVSELATCSQVEEVDVNVVPENGYRKTNIYIFKVEPSSEYNAYLREDSVEKDGTLIALGQPKLFASGLNCQILKD